MAGTSSSLMYLMSNCVSCSIRCESSPSTLSSLCPAVSNDAAKAIRHRVKRWRLHLWSGQDLADLAHEINPTVRGWINYYGRFYRTELILTLKRINVYLVRWAMRKYKRLRARPQRANRFLAAIAKREPGLFAHWTSGAQPTAG